MSGVAEILRDLFDEYEGPITRELNAKSVSQWDSLANVQLMVMVEQKFKMKFSIDEIGGMKNLGELIDLVGRASGRSWQ